MLAPTLSIPLASPHGGSLRFGSATAHLPPSPPIEDSRCSLPSISKLLGLADAATPGSETALPAYLIQSSPRSQDLSSKRNYAEFAQAFAHGSRTSPTSVRTALSARNMPPTPPLRSERSFDGRDVPLPKMDSPCTTTFVNNRLCETTPPCEPDLRQYQAAQAHATTPRCLPTPCHQQPTPSTPFAAPSPVSSCCAPAPPGPTLLHPAIPGLAYHLPLPQGFRPLMNPSPVPSPWQQQHHHYLSSPQEASFSHGQDKYVCATCRKAFSRPSSLRIHIHSHTGEKPFKCPHAGCGKAFSVRSNMKRHERGCHSFELGDRNSLRAL